MVLDSEPVIFWNWIGPALWSFLAAAGALALVALVVGFLVLAFRHGPVSAGDSIYRMLRTALADFLSTSPRRILALAWLAAQESLRRRVLIGFGIFLLILLFAGWFLDTRSSDPATLYLSFVLTATTYLVLLIALFLSAFSLPADFKSHTIYTIVTKPVRAGEIVLGRILGFSIIGTLLLAVMGLCSYVFVVRVLNHTHEVDYASLKDISNDPGAQTGRTSLAQNHRHQVTIDADGTGSTDMAQGHFHEITPQVNGDKTTYVMGPPEGLLTARVPAYGTLRFKDRTGKGSNRGISVGKEWKYHSYIEGATLAAAIWKFENISPENFPDGRLPLEMTIRVFRSYKGDIEKGIRGSIVLKNPRTGRASAEQFFVCKDYYIDRRDIPRELTDPAGQPLDLFDDLAPDGELEVWVQCLDDSQYFGVAKGDLYLRARDASFTGNFVKSYISIWVQMLLVTSFGVMFSTFLSGPVAMMATLATLLMGFRAQFIFDVAKGAIEGGGPIESLVRILKQQNVTTQLEPGFTSSVIQGVDKVFMTFMTAVTDLLPNFGKFSDVNYVAHGFDIPPDLVLQQLVTAAGYVVAVFAIGYLFLRTREVAR